MDGPIIVVIGLLVVVAVAAWSAYARRKRREGLAFVARQLGLSYAEQDTYGCLRYPFQLLRRGDGRGTENVLTGSWQEMEIVAFDYWFYTESTDSKGHRTKSYSHFSCAVTEIRAALSPVSIGRESVLTRLADAVGLDDIAFETEEFNRAFNVTSKDRRCANDLIDQRMMAWLLSAPSDLSFESSGRWLLCFSKRRAPAELIALLGTLRGFRDQVPRVVYDLYPVSPDQSPVEAVIDPTLPPRPDGRY